jgi:hypothetical protein
LKKQTPPIELSEAEIRAVAQGEEAVVKLVSQLSN